MRYRAITVTWEYGSGGSFIGRALAERLGWKLLDHELIEKLAQRLQVSIETCESCDERASGWASRILKAFWAGNAESFSPGAPEGVVDRDSIARATATLITEAADEGEVVIMGRGSQCILSGRADVLHVFIFSDQEEKFRRLANHHANEAEMLSAIQHHDRTRSEYLRAYYGCDWKDRGLYDLMLNSRIGNEDVLSAILSAAKPVERR